MQGRIKIWLIATLLLTSCKLQGESFPMMGELSETPMIEGYVGCKWINQKTKTYAPLKGVLKFKSIDCHSEDGIKPKYGYESKFVMSEANKLRFHKLPIDPKAKNENRPSEPIITLHKTPESDVQSFMDGFVDTKAPENCIIDQNNKGVWLIGYSKEYLISQGYEILSPPEYQDIHGDSYIRQQNLIVADDDDFPYEWSIATECRPNKERWEEGGRKVVGLSFLDLLFSKFLLLLYQQMEIEFR